MNILYEGVSYKERFKKYIARIVPGKGEKRIILGYYNTAEEAAAAYDKAAIFYHGEYARTNESMGLLGDKRCLA